MSDFVEGLRMTVLEAKPIFNHFALTGRQRFQYFANPISQQQQVHEFAGRVGGMIAQEILERSLTFAAHWLVQADRMATNDPQRTSVFRLDAQFRGNFFDRWLATKL